MPSTAYLLLSIVAGVIGIIWWRLRRKTPDELAKEQRDKINKAIADGKAGVDDLNVLLDDSLDRVSKDKSRGDTK